MTQEQNIKTSPRDFFLHLLQIATLYASAISFLVLAFQYVNVLIPDMLQGGYYQSQAALSGIRWGISILVIAFPVYLFVDWFFRTEFLKNPEKRNARVRKWLVYFTLFVAALVIIGDITTLLYRFLGGELTMRFFWKVLAVLFVTGSIFGFHLLQLRAERANQNTFSGKKFFAWGVPAVLLALCVLGALRIGSPMQERARKFDERRLENLQYFQSQILTYWMNKQTVPDSLEAANDTLANPTLPTDPETGENYEYSKKDATSFVLCATFNKASEGDEYTRMGSAKPVSADPIDLWNHPAGHFCFERTINPNIYKPINAVPVKN